MGIRARRDRWIIDGEIRGAVPPSEDPRRVEAVVVMVADRSTEEVWTATIDRRSGPRLGEWKLASALSGNFLEPLRSALRRDAKC